MDTFLRPGMRLLRRFAVAGKFFTIALVLIIPLSLLASESIMNASSRHAFSLGERCGLTLARPLTLLIADLHQWRIAAVTGRDRADLTPAIRAMDEAETTAGQRLGIHAEWLQLRHEVTALTSSGHPSPKAAVNLAARQTTTFLGRISSTSRLIPDRHDDQYLATILVDHLPDLLDVAATAAESLPPDRPLSAEDASTIQQQLTTSARQLSDELDQAMPSARETGPGTRLRPAWNALQLALTDYGTALSRGPHELGTTGSSGRQVTSAATTMITVLADALDVLLSEHARSLFWQSAAPAVIALTAVLAAAYLFAALARSTSGEVRWVLADINALTTEAPHQSDPLGGSDEFADMSRAIAVARDHLTALLGTLRHQATHDELTALANRTLFSEKLAEALADPTRRPGVVVIDLDGIEDVTDSFGHAIGDRLLRSLGTRFHRAARRQNLVARLEPDQFGLLILDTGPDEDALLAAETLKAAMEQPVGVDGRLLRVRARAGIAISPEGGTTATELLRNADVAVHAARRNGAGNLAVFEPAMHEATRERTELSSELVHAIEKDQLTIVYQPIVNLTTDVIHGVEALARWKHPERGAIPPSVFVPLAEATGLIVPIGRWVMRQAVRQLARWQSERPDQHRLSMDINLSADQLGDEELVGEVLSLINETGVNPHSIVLEITESTVVRDFDTALRQLSQLSRMGVRLALDDFGTGYSSLSYLRRLPVSALKIDKSFVTTDLDAPDAFGSGDVLLRGIASLGAGLGLQVIAEGIETAEQARRLRDVGCHFGQGYHWSHPVKAADLTNLVTASAHPITVPHPRGSTPTNRSPLSPRP